jgi:hypothetical protein
MGLGACGRVSRVAAVELLAVQSAHAAIVQANLNGLGLDEAAFAKDQLGAACLVLIHVHADEALDHPPLAGSHLSHFN